MDFKTEHRASPHTVPPREFSDSTGWIFDIKRFAVNDGPGIRTTIFFKGCSLRCKWCHNPESLNPEPEILVQASKCIACGACLEVCPHRAHRIDANNERMYARNLCDLCGRCVEACYAEALVIAGKRVSVEDVMRVVRADAKYYEISGGGVTLSGGEPLVQRGFAVALLMQCKTEGFHTALDTCGQVEWAVIEEALLYVDLVLYDFKHSSPKGHKRFTGASNHLILDNLRRLSETGVLIEIRMPILPTINDSKATIESTARLLGSLNNILAVRLLPYHRLAGSKYKSLGRENTMPNVASPSRNQLQQIASWIRPHGLKVIVPAI